MNTNANDIMECPICMDPIDGEKNKVVTECGHCFHSNCLMTNIVHNGFGCPYCRTVMAEVPEEDDESEDEYDDWSVVEEVDNSDALQGMRILFQRAEGEEIEEYDDEDSDSDDGSEDSFDGEIEPRASLAFVTQKLIQRGVSMEDLVAAILIRDHEEYEHHEEFMRTDNELFGKFRIIISNFVPEPAEEVVEEVAEVVEEVVVGVEKEKSEEQNENMDECNNTYYQKQRALRYEMIDSTAQPKHSFQFQMKGSCRN
jgi:hypothetical protein